MNTVQIASPKSQDLTCFRTFHQFTSTKTALLLKMIYESAERPRAISGKYNSQKHFNGSFAKCGVLCTLHIMR